MSTWSTFIQHRIPQHPFAPTLHTIPVSFVSILSTPTHTLSVCTSRSISFACRTSHAVNYTSHIIIIIITYVHLRFRKKQTHQPVVNVIFIPDPFNVHLQPAVWHSLYMPSAPETHSIYIRTYVPTYISIIIPTASSTLFLSFVPLCITLSLVRWIDYIIQLPRCQLTVAFA